MPRMTLKNIALTALALCVAINLFQLCSRTISEYRVGSRTGLHSLSYQFVPLQGVFKNIPRAGYYTDKNMEHPLAIAQYQQAQYVLAPTVLEIGNTALPLVIFDCTTPQVAINTINALKLLPITASPTGLILAANPKAKS